MNNKNKKSQSDRKTATTHSGEKGEKISSSSLGAEKSKVSDDVKKSEATSEKPVTDQSAPEDQPVVDKFAQDKPVGDKSSPDKEVADKSTQDKEMAENKEDRQVQKKVEPTMEQVESPQQKTPKEEIKLSGLYAFKLAMSSLYDEKGQFIPVTFLHVKPWVVSQIKQKEKEGYNSVQLACMPQKNNRSSKSLKTHLAPAGFAEGARYIREIRQDSVDNIEVGQSVSIHSLQKGDKVKVCAISKGHGFTGVVKRWDFKGGPASHGSKTHRTGGSIGNRTEPARVMPGKKMAGHYGVEKTTLKNVRIMDVISDKNLIVVKGPVPGARNSLVFLSKMNEKLGVKNA